MEYMAHSNIRFFTDDHSLAILNLHAALDSHPKGFIIATANIQNARTGMSKRQRNRQKKETTD